jgi:hypothetical protein
MTRDELIACIKEELNRQCMMDIYETPYLYNEGPEDIGVDGMGPLADAILKKLAE